MAESLTLQEQQAQISSLFDLGPGYPSLDMREFSEIASIIEESVDLELADPRKWNANDESNLNRELESSLREVLRIPQHVTIIPVMTGSIALERTIRTILKGNDLEVITTSPSIDIVPLMVRENDVEPRFVAMQITQTDFSISVCSLINDLRVEASDGAQSKLIIAASPENPTGCTWSLAEFSSLLGAAEESKSYVLIDHCFLIAGVQPASRPAAIWDTDVIYDRWVGVWDTGKLMGLGGTKIAFIVTPNIELAERVQSTLNVLQFDVSRRDKYLVSRILSCSDFTKLIRRVSNHSAENASLLKNQVESIGLKVLAPSAGTFAMIQLPRGMNSRVVRQSLLENVQVGTIAADVFFHHEPLEQSFIRIALARDPAFFEDAVRRLTNGLRVILADQSL